MKQAYSLSDDTLQCPGRAYWIYWQTFIHGVS